MAEVELFRRAVQTVVAPVDGSDGIDVTGLRTVFRVEKTSSSEPNTATIQIYNLAPTSRLRIESKDQAVLLRAGYQDLIQQLAVGVVKRVEHRRDGVDVVTELEVKDGGAALLEPEFRRSYAAGTSRRKIVADIIAAMPNTATGIISATGVSGTTRAKIALSTTCKLALDRLARSWSFEWSIQDGAVQVIDREGTIDPVGLALVVSPETGLIGSPARTGLEGLRGKNTRTRKPRSGARFSTLLIPDLIPGKFVELRSEFVTGFFKVQSVEHEGDTHGAEWNSHVEAVQL